MTVNKAIMHALPPTLAPEPEQVEPADATRAPEVERLIRELEAEGERRVQRLRPETPRVRHNEPYGLD
jgi:hypothetical protein